MLLTASRNATESRKWQSVIGKAVLMGFCVGMMVSHEVQIRQLFTSSLSQPAGGSRTLVNIGKH